MDWLLCAKFAAFFIMMVSLECSCEWHIKVNQGKGKNGQILWEPLQLKRQKREWIAAPVHMREEEDNRYRNPIAQVRSDIEIKMKITYRVSGPGVDRPPLGIFFIDPNTGDLNVTGAIVDREEIAIFYLVVHATSGRYQELEKPLELRVRVMDINDNPPVFSQSVFYGSVEECSQSNTEVMRIFATDADEENNLNSKIAYKIVMQNPADPPMFIMNQFTGQVFTMSNSLDRELYSSFNLMVTGSDLNGAAGGQSAQCGSTIKILDVNDNFPILERESYSIEITENTLSEGLLWMQVSDADEIYSDNWLAEFDIVSGNDGGWFVIETDAQTNRGVLKVVQELDYETMKMQNLAFVVRNKAAYHSSVISEYRETRNSVNIKVLNLNEGPIFVPSTRYVEMPANIQRESMFSYVLAKFTAMDRETGQAATNVIYMKGWDAENWLVIDRITGELRLARQMTRDSANVFGGKYNATILAINNDTPSRTATVTVVIDVPRAIENCPVITSEPRIMCLDSPRVVITAYDNQTAANGPPLTFNLVSQPTTDVGPWTLLPLNATSVTLVGPTNLNARNTTVYVTVTNQGNTNCQNPWSIPLRICECTANRRCDNSKSTSKNVSLGPAAIGLMILGFLALLLVPLLLLLCVCGGGAGGKGQFIPVPPENDGEYRTWGHEGPKPEDVEVLNLDRNPDCQDFTTRREALVGSGPPGFGERGDGFGTENGRMSGIGGQSGIIESEETGTRRRAIGLYGEGSLAGGGITTYKEGGAVNMAFVENYFAEKADFYANEEESRPANDCLLIYDNEGIGSPAGSIGCCSFIADDLDDSYLDTLGFKFKTLAEICSGKEFEPLLNGNVPRLSANVPYVETGANMFIDESSLSVHGNSAVRVSDSNFVAESLYSSANLQPARPIPESYVPGNVVVTETYTTSGAAMQPTTFTVDPRHQPNILVTERVVRPASAMHNMLDFPNLADGSNVVLRETMIAPNSSGLSNSFNMIAPNSSGLSNSFNMIAPNSSGLSNSFNMIAPNNIDTKNFPKNDLMNP
ncbi:hypothetical protein FKM82_006189 [Ascaphus truei]